ncbi:MAG TPA: methylenetetrahydrofolate reductase [NAD(P)H], partial [Prevotella sp.]|nr:methylenetetrahydrofolate reductase [NAD(P)H] [Prevotella sp.]
GDGPAHATDLIEQVNRFNGGHFWDGTEMKCKGEPFHYGVACYPEKHEEAANLEADLAVLKMKADLGAEYAVTQLFYDNEKYFSLVRRAREAGITIPIIPGIKPLAKLTQVTQVPKTFHCDMPQELAKEAVKCANDEDVRQLGIEWAVSQCKELYANGVKDIHFYTVSAFKSMPDILRQIL